MNRNPIMLLLLVSLIFISACQAESIPATSTEEKTVIPSITTTPTPTEIPVSSLPIEEISEKILTGEEIDISFMSDEQKATLGSDLANRFSKNNNLDLSKLSSEQRNTLSEALAEIKNDEAGINFISFTYVKGEKYYINPNTLAMEKMPANPDEEFKKENSFEIYIPVTTDAQGNISYMYNGEVTTIPAGIDFNTEITDSNDPRINWPDTQLIESGDFAGLTYLQRLLKDKSAEFNSKATLAVVHKDALGEIPVAVGPAFNKQEIFSIVRFETDSGGKPILANVSILIPRGALGLYEEGTETEIVAGAGIKEYGSLWKTLEDDQLYYLFIPTNPKAALESGSFATFENISGVNEPNEIELLVVSDLMKKKD